MGYDTSWSGEGLTIVPPLSPKDVKVCNDLRKKVPFSAPMVNGSTYLGTGSTEWAVSEAGDEVVVDGDRGLPLEWLQLIHETVVVPAGSGIFGALEWEGEDGALDDSGRIQCEGDVIRIFDAKYEVNWVERGVEVAKLPKDE